MTTATFTRSDVMKAAWAALRTYGPARDLETLRRRLSREMAQAWFTLKRRAQLVAMSKIERLQDALSALRNVDRMTPAHRAEEKRLTAEIAAEAHKEAAPIYAEKAERIAAAGGRFCTVTFTKKDGTERTMQVQPATLRHHVKGGDATDAGKRAVATRKALHPNLLPVWDVAAQAPRSVNLATVSRIAVDGRVFEYS